ncbi:fumarylacetoacetate hydrolase family protein [Nocardia noduli]|uniref:fumarylacetoacetate hydrolase family protein n=1 Tax=Nocardia noduli TaxID=2815722 RepID=UPI001C2430D2|nr:fumarylacetoacetate hydrolase family protein [Nocardia noduli]
MRILRYSDSSGHIALGRLTDDRTIQPLDIGDSPIGAAAALHAVPATGSTPIPLGEVWLLAPIPRPGKFLALALNFRGHNKEVGAADPEHPIFFNKQTTCVCGPGDDVVVPAVSQMVDYEGELGVVIGRVARHVTAREAMACVAGYLIVNDVSVRDWQMPSPTTTFGKSFDTHGPLGPWLSTADEVDDPMALTIKTWVNDELRQNGTTSDMLFSIAEQIAYASVACTLEPGDVIATGTPEGVGLSLTPPRWLRPGDRVRIAIEGLGELENPVVGSDAAH